jgi:hypothetical protein
MAVVVGLEAVVALVLEVAEVVLLALEQLEPQPLLWVVFLVMLILVG